MFVLRQRAPLALSNVQSPVFKMILDPLDHRVQPLPEGESSTQPQARLPETSSATVLSSGSSGAALTELQQTGRLRGRGGGCYSLHAARGKKAFLGQPEFV